MGVSLSIPTIQGLVTSSGNGAPPVAATSYAFANTNTAQFGVQATISAGTGGTTATAKPTLIFTGRDGSITRVPCAPDVVAGAPAVTTSLLCPVSNLAFGPGSATISLRGFTNTFFFYFTTQSTQTATQYVYTTITHTQTVTVTSTPVTTATVTPTVTLTGASSTVYTGCTTTTTPSSTKLGTTTTTSSPTKSITTTSKQPICRLISWSNNKQIKRDAGYQGPDITLSLGAKPTPASTSTTSTVTVTDAGGTPITATVTGKNTSTVTTTLTSSVTVDQRTIATVSGCAPDPTTIE